VPAILHLLTESGLFALTLGRGDFFRVAPLILGFSPGAYAGKVEFFSQNFLPPPFGAPPDSRIGLWFCLPLMLCQFSCACGVARVSPRYLPGRPRFITSPLFARVAVSRTFFPPRTIYHSPMCCVLQLFFGLSPLPVSQISSPDRKSVFNSLSFSFLDRTFAVRNQLCPISGDSFSFGPHLGYGGVRFRGVFQQEFLLVQRVF